MRKLIAAFLLCVAVPALALAYLGLRGGDDFERRETERLRAEAQAALGEALPVLARDLADLVAEADAFLESSGAALVSDDNRPIFLITRDGQRTARPRPAVGTREELLLFRRSLRGGERAEFVERDLIQAAEAYTFFLHRLSAPSLRAAVLHRAASCLERAGTRALAAVLFQEIADRYGGAAGPDDEPLDVLALMALERLGDAERTASLERLRRLRHAVSPAWASALGRELGAPDPSAAGLSPEGLVPVAQALGRIPAEFTAAGRLFRCRPIAEGSEILAGTSIDLARLAVRTPAAAGGDIAVRFEPLLLPRPAGPGDRAFPAPLGPDRVAAELLATESGVPVGFAVAESPRLSEIKAAAGRRSLWFHGVVAVLVTVAAAGGFLVVRALRAELRLLKLKSEFIANVSHEMKTPVSAVRLFAEMLAEDSLEPAKARQFAQVLRGESERLSAIVENLLDFNRLERGDWSLAREPVALDALLRSLAEGFAARAEREGVRFSAEVDGLGTVASNGDAVARIVQNLLDNAFKYRRAGGHAEVALAGRASGDRILLEVRDNGIGIAREDRERIFERFYRVHPEDAGVRGTGMGLSLARALARRLDGDIAVESAPGQGSTFTLILPRREGPAS